MTIAVRALVGAALLGIACGAAAQAPQATSPTSAETGQSLDPSPHLPLKLAPADLQLFRTFDAFRSHAIANAQAASDNDPASVAAAAQVLAGAPRAIANESALIGGWRCRSAQFSDGSIQKAHLSGVFVYPYFQCAITRKANRLFFAKTSGSHRQSGFLYRVDPTRYAFLGGESVNNDPRRAYGAHSESNVIGWLSQVDAKRLLLQMPSEKYGDLEVLELTR